MNPGFDKKEINQLRAECKAENRMFIYVEDEFQEEENEEHAHIQFLGDYKGQEVIYDALIYTLRLHHSSLVYDLALEQLQKQMPGYIPADDRPAATSVNIFNDEEAEELLYDFIDEIEEEEEIKVREHVDLDADFNYGIGLEIGLNLDLITEEVITKFIDQFSAGKLQLDPNVYSFKGANEDE